MPRQGKCCCRAACDWCRERGWAYRNTRAILTFYGWTQITSEQTNCVVTNDGCVGLEGFAFAADPDPFHNYFFFNPAVCPQLVPIEYTCTYVAEFSCGTVIGRTYQLATFHPYVKSGVRYGAIYLRLSEPQSSKQAVAYADVQLDGYGRWPACDGYEKNSIPLTLCPSSDTMLLCGMPTSCDLAIVKP